MTHLMMTMFSNYLNSPVIWPVVTKHYSTSMVLPPEYVCYAQKLNADTQQYRR